MYLLCKSAQISEIVFCAKSINSLRRYVNALDFPSYDTRYELFVYDQDGSCVGCFVRFSPFFNSSFIKSPRYGTENPATIWIAFKASEMGTRCRHLLDRYYPDCAQSDFVRFNATNRY